MRNLSHLIEIKLTDIFKIEKNKIPISFNQIGIKKAFSESAVSAKIDKLRNANFGVAAVAGTMAASEGMRQSNMVAGITLVIAMVLTFAMFADSLSREELDVDEATARTVDRTRRNEALRKIHNNNSYRNRYLKKVLPGLAKTNEDIDVEFEHKLFIAMDYAFGQLQYLPTNYDVAWAMTLHYIESEITLDEDTDLVEKLKSSKVREPATFALFNFWTF